LASSVSQHYSFTINPAPTLGTLAPTQWTVNQANYPGSIAISNGTGPFTVSAQSGLPTGLTATVTTTNVTFTGTPTTAGTFNNVQIIVQDAAGATVSGTFSITINPATRIVTAKSVGGQVNVFDDSGAPRFSLAPYGAAYTGGVRVAVGDVTGDGISDIITGNRNLLDLLHLDLLLAGYYIARRGYITLSLPTTAADIDGFVAVFGRILDRHASVIHEVVGPAA
jgi:hypothetical protein